MHRLQYLHVLLVWPSCILSNVIIFVFLHVLIRANNGVKRTKKHMPRNKPSSKVKSVNNGVSDLTNNNNLESMKQLYLDRNTGLALILQQLFGIIRKKLLVIFRSRDLFVLQVSLKYCLKFPLAKNRSF